MSINIGYEVDMNKITIAMKTENGATMVESMDAHEAILIANQLKAISQVMIDTYTPEDEE